MTLINIQGRKMSQRLSEARFDSIDIPELIGLCKGVLADGSINLSEAQFIQRWLHDRSSILELWPANDLDRLLGRVLADGVLSQDEEAELVELLQDITGEPVSVLFY